MYFEKVCFPCIAVYSPNIVRYAFLHCINNDDGGEGKIFLRSFQNSLFHSDVCVCGDDDGDGLLHVVVFPVLHKNEQPSQMHLVPFV